MAAAYFGCIRGRLYLIGLVVAFCGSGLLPTIMDCEGVPRPDFFGDAKDVLTGDRDLSINLSDGTITVGPSKKEIIIYCSIAFGALLMVIGCCVCCCRRRDVIVRSTIIQGNPNPNSAVGYYK